MKKLSFKDPFKIKENGSTLKKELIAGLITFVCMCYILPVNSGILSSMGMDQSGVFAMTAIVSVISTLLMGIIANYPIALSAGMGLNAFLTYNVALGIFGNTPNGWQKAMILLTFSGILFFIFSLTPLRTKMINAIPKDIKAIVSAGLGAFICFVGLKGSGIIEANDGTLVSFGSFIKVLTPADGSIIYDPSTLIAFFGIILVIALMFLSTRKNKLKNFAIPITLVTCAIISLICAYSGLNIYGSIDANGVYNNGLINFADPKNWYPSGIQNVVFFGYFGNEASVPTQSFGQLLLDIFKEPSSYIAIFSLIFVNLFDTTSTLITIGKDANILDENGNLNNGQRAVLADATGALICAPLGTSTVTSFAESAAGVVYGGRTGLTAISTSLFFLLSIFIYPIFSFFTTSAVTCCALFGVGAMIFTGNMKEIDWKSPIIATTAFISLIFTLLTYSISMGFGIGLVFYSAMMLVSKKGKEVHPAIYIISLFYLIDIILTELLKHL